MKFKIFFLLAAPVLFTLSACEKGTDDEIPSYISIDKIDLGTNTDIEGGEGSIISPNIKDAWVYVDNEFIGNFELPATIPILKSGTHTLRVDAGILINGINGLRAAYPFYTSFNKQVELVKKETLKITTDPKITYYKETKFAWKENFEGGISVDSISGSSTQMQKCTDPTIVYEGDGCGAIYLDGDHQIFQGVSNGKFVLPKGGNFIFLEINVRTDNELAIGIQAFDASGNGAQIAPVGINNTKGEWKKIYVNLTSYVSRYETAVNYKIFFGAVKDDALSTASIFLDNIKLVHF